MGNSVAWAICSSNGLPEDPRSGHWSPECQKLYRRKAEGVPASPEFFLEAFHMPVRVVVREHGQAHHRPFVKIVNQTFTS